MTTHLLGATSRSVHGFSLVLALFINFTFCVCSVKAQAFRNLDGAREVPISDTRSIAQDSKGFIWLATHTGLIRYDSNTLKQYKNSSEDAHSISSDQLQAVFCDSKKNLWVGGSGGLDLYNSDTDNFNHVSHDLPNTNPELNKQIYFISEDRDHSILVGTPFGLNRLRVEHGKVKITNILHRVFKGSTQDILCVGRTANGDYWAGSGDGLVHVPNNGGKPRLFRVVTKEKSPGLNYFSTLYVDAQNDIWLGRSAGGLVRFDTRTEEFQVISNLKTPGGTLPLVNKILPGKNGNLWIATYSGLVNFDPIHQKATWHKNQLGNVFGMMDEMIQTIGFDRQGGIWLGSFFSGVSYFYPDAPHFDPWPFLDEAGFNSRNLNAGVGRNDRGGMWIVASDLSNLRLFEGLGPEYRQINLSLPPSFEYNRFYLDNEQVFWAAGNAVLTSYNLRTKSYRHYSVEVGEEKKLMKGKVFSMLEDTKGRFWVIGTFGALQFDKKSYRFKEIELVTYSQSILEDAQKNIWIGGGDEVFLLRNGQSNFERLLTDKGISSGNFAAVSRVVEDSAGKIWVVTRQGLQWFDKRSNKFYRDSKINLENIIDVQIDRLGYLWLVTNTEVTRYNSSKGSLQTYEYKDGLPFKGVFRESSGTADNTGNLYFTTSTGMFRFSPEKFATDGKVSPIIFTSLKLSGARVKSGDRSELLSTDIDRIETLKLKYDQNIFSLHFALTSYYRSEWNRYAYKMENFDKDWIYTSSPTATYMNLPAGEYVFYVKASNGDGFWTNEIRKLTIQVQPPWWKTWYAYALYILLTGTAIYLLILFFGLRTSLKKENELYQAKLDFFTNISHEVRTHLSLIVAPLEKAFGLQPENTAIKTYLTYARNNSGKLMLLVNELLDFRKIQNGSSRLQVHRFDLVKVFHNILSSFEHLAAEKGIEIQFDHSVEVITIWCDLSQMQKVFYNLLSNAFKFTSIGGIVAVRITELSNEVIIELTDNGCGIPSKDLNHLFENFFQSHGTNATQGGHGIGLALSKAIIDLHHGYLTVKSRVQTKDQLGQTIFTIRLLTGREHFSEDQFGKGETVQSTHFRFGEATENGLPNHSSTKKRNTILIIEDNDELRAFEEEIFGGLYQIFSAADGIAGLELAFESLPDLILCDVMMPGLNGIEVCSRLKADNRTSHIPIILLTARSAVSQVIEGLTACADDYLVKPFDPNILSLKVSNLIGIRAELRRGYNTALSLGSDDKLVEDIHNAFIIKLHDLVIQNVSESGFGVNEIALHVGMSVSVLYRKLRSLTGMTVNDFVKTIKMKRALSYLESGNFHVNEVAMMVGYGDVRHFSKEFKKIHGKNPSQFRKQSQENE